MAVAFTRLSWLFWGAKEREPTITTGSGSGSGSGSKLKSVREQDTHHRSLTSVNGGSANKVRSKRTKKKWHSREERRIDREFDVVLVPSDGGCASGSESDASDWSIGWMEPHAPDFLSEDDEGESSFAVLVPCYGRGRNDVASHSRNPILGAISDLTNGYNADIHRADTIYTEMLQRAASNAYSWWWASHIRTKQSKWLDHQLQDMEDKVKYMLTLIEEDGDSFAKRAEMYYKRRPELIGFVEEAYRAYRALAERYDRISGDLHNANHTIATVFPEKVQLAIDDEEYEEDSSLRTSPYSLDPTKVPKKLPDVPKKTVPKLFMSQRRAEDSPRKPPNRLQRRMSRISMTTGTLMTKAEALEEIDKLQKGILALQTEKEFVKSSYDNGLAKYWEIEKEIAEMQEKVGSLQDEFNAGTVIEDDEARALMASRALQSCQDTLAQLQEKQEKLAEEASEECGKIKDVRQKLDIIKLQLFQGKEDEQSLPMKESSDSNPTLKVLEKKDSDLQEKPDEETAHEKIKAYFSANSDLPSNATELAEKIDELVTKVVNLETAMSAQSSLVQRLRSETDELRAHLHSLEEDKAALIKDSNDSSTKIQDLEDKLQAVQDLNRSFQDQQTNLQTHFTEAHCSLSLLSEKLTSMRLFNEENKNLDPSPAKGSLVSESHKNHEEERLAKTEEIPSVSANDSNDLIVPAVGGDQSGEVLEPDQKDQIVETDPSLSLDSHELQRHSLDIEDTPNWQHLFTYGLDDKEKILMEEYTSVLRKYKEAKRELNASDKRNRESIFEVMLQLRDMKNSNIMKDEEIRALRQKLELAQVGEEITDLTESTDLQQELISQPSSNSIVNSGKRLSDYLREQNTDDSMQKDGTEPFRDGNILPRGEVMMKDLLNEPCPTIEEKFRKDLDELLEENLKFWFRFSTSIHQVHKYKTEIQDLHGEFLSLKDNRSQDSNATKTLQEALKLDARPIYQHLREIQTELTVWLEQNILLKDDLDHRLSCLQNIQEEISRIPQISTGDENVEFSSYQAAKYLGEVLNMQQENKKLADELQAGMNRVKGLQLEVEKTIANMDEDFKLSTSKDTSLKQSPNWPKIPLRAFLFGVKVKKHKPSLFSCMNPVLQKQYSDLQYKNPP
ncbi:hypothetical protein Sjap_010507 [Stephania japonica]|uniref:NAB domain-containing protein n=1 Tax=Stephania japonica TaxID=461633 RepID=A0AAP0JBC0_9MAGN